MAERNRGKRIMEKAVTDVRAAAAAIAPILGGTVSPDYADSHWQAAVLMPDGLKVIVLKPYGSKGEIVAYLPRPDYPGESVQCGKIGADIAKAPEKLARDIERRLLPLAAEKTAAARAKWTEQESARDDLERLAADFAKLPGVRVSVEKAGTGDQRLEIHYYQEGKGGLTAEMYGSGNLYVKNVTAWGADRESQVRALIAALAD
jgi:hypothetical protein